MRKLKIHCLQHVHFEGPAIIHKWALHKGHEFGFTRFYDAVGFPEIEEIDWLVIMGGPMGVDEYDEYPWLKKEIEYIRQAIAGSKVVIGICLGAQLIARALGAAVKHGQKQEIGWFPVTINKIAATRAGFDFLPEEITAFHWHQDTFDIPEDSLQLASSKAYPNQAFLYRNTILALQFHFEMDFPALEAIVRNSGAGIKPGEYVQSVKAILGNKQNILKNNEMMRKILECFENVSEL
ncbi:MAG TPA: type 1 glutamine amidotransferase [Bacteroidales bacterium]|nr:type 1 glutamine amidotransferase [Bacteroidales bacterium]